MGVEDNPEKDSKLRPVRKKRLPPGGQVILKVPQPNFPCIAPLLANLFEPFNVLQACRHDLTRRETIDRNEIAFFLPK
jgi:hypothetical protein